VPGAVAPADEVGEGGEAGTPGVVATVATADAADVAVSADGAASSAAADAIAIAGVVAIPVPVVAVGVGGCGVDGWAVREIVVVNVFFSFAPEIDGVRDVEETMPRNCARIFCTSRTNERLHSPGAPGEKGDGEGEIYIVCVYGTDTGSDPWRAREHLLM
jgi:hypothetical protein